MKLDVRNFFCNVVLIFDANISVSFLHLSVHDGSPIESLQALMLSNSRHDPNDNEYQRSDYAGNIISVPSVDSFVCDYHLLVEGREKQRW